MPGGRGGRQVRNAVASPCLCSDGSIEGVLIAFNKLKGGNFSKRDEHIAASLARDFAIALRACAEAEVLPSRARNKERGMSTCLGRDSVES